MEIVESKNTERNIVDTFVGRPFHSDFRTSWLKSKPDVLRTFTLNYDFIKAKYMPNVIEVHGNMRVSKRRHFVLPRGSVIQNLDLSLHENSKLCSRSINRLRDVEIKSLVLGEGDFKIHKSVKICELTCKGSKVVFPKHYALKTLYMVKGEATFEDYITVDDLILNHIDWKNTILPNGLCVKKSMTITDIYGKIKESPLKEPMLVKGELCLFGCNFEVPPKVVFGGIKRLD